MRLMLPALTTVLLTSSLLSHSAYAQREKRTTPSAKQSSQKNQPATAKFGKESGNNRATRTRDEAMNAFTLTVGGITSGEHIPTKFAYCLSNGKGGTVAGENISPFIQWSPPPEGTKSLAFLVVDKDVPATFENANVPEKTIALEAPRQDFYHWVLVDIPPNLSGILEGKDSSGIIPGGKQFGTQSYGTSGQNDYVKMSQGPHGGYDGPCPPWNDNRLHNYHFTIYALDIPSLKLPNPVTGAQAMIIMKDHIIAQSDIVAPFTTNPAWLNQQPRPKTTKPSRINKRT